MEKEAAAPARRPREGSLESPTRHALLWQDPNFADHGKTEAEMRRIFEICHGCRRCFNLCDAFPRLVDLHLTWLPEPIRAALAEDFA